MRRMLEIIEKELQGADNAAQAAGVSASSTVALQVSAALHIAFINLASSKLWQHFWQH